MDTPDSFAVDVGSRVKVFDFTGDVVGHVSCVEGGDPPCAGLTGQQVLPEGGHIVADRGQGPHAGDEDSRHIKTHFLVPWLEQVAGTGSWGAMFPAFSTEKVAVLPAKPIWSPAGPPA